MAKKEYKYVKKFTITARIFYWRAFQLAVGILSLLVFFYGINKGWSLISPVMLLNGVSGIFNVGMGMQVLETFEFKKTRVKLTEAEKLLGD